MNLLKRFFRLSVPILIIASPLIFWLNHQAIFDWYQLRNYKPPQAISALASADGMDSKSKNIFFVNHPLLLSDVKQFRSDCTSSEQTIVLGCYHSDQAGIYIYNVQDARLSGVQEVTAAHEMLHAAYDRLSKSDKDKVNSMLLDFYQNNLSDQRIKDTIDEYKKTEPNDVVNEMHSIFGTEVANLPNALENYYKQYFTNRSLVVGFSQKYEAEFSSRKAKADVYESQLSALKSKISSEERNLRTMAAQIEAQRVSLDSLKTSNHIDEFNSQVASFNATVDSYNAQVNAYKLDVTSYNKILVEYNTVAGELNTLFDAIDTRVSVPSTKVGN